MQCFTLLRAWPKRTLEVTCLSSDKAIYVTLKWLGTLYLQVQSLMLDEQWKNFISRKFSCHSYILFYHFCIQTYNAKEVHNWKRISDHSNLALFIYCKKKLFFGCVGDFQVNDWWHLIARQKNDLAQCEQIKNLLSLEENFVKIH